MSNTKKNKLKARVAIAKEQERVRQRPLMILRKALTQVETQSWTGSRDDYRAQRYLMDAVAYLESANPEFERVYTPYSTRLAMQDAGFEG